jgi:hypothetical protein
MKLDDFEHMTFNVKPILNIYACFCLRNVRGAGILLGIMLDMILSKWLSVHEIIFARLVWISFSKGDDARSGIETHLENIDMFLFDNFRMGGISVDMMLDLVLSTCDL